MPKIFDGSQPKDKKNSKAASSAQNANPDKTKKRSAGEYSSVIRNYRQSFNPLDAFAAVPFNTAFDSQHTDEEVVLLLRQHPVTQIKWVLIALGLTILPFIFPFFTIFDFLPGVYQFAAMVFWYLLVIGFSLEAFLSWFFNVYIITDERVVDVDFLSLIYKNVSSAKLDNIEDITATSGGALRAVFDFGTVTIQTAGAEVEFQFENVPFPSRVTSLLNELLIEEEREKIEGRTNWWSWAHFLYCKPVSF